MPKSNHRGDRRVNFVEQEYEEDNYYYDDRETYLAEPEYCWDQGHDCEYGNDIYCLYCGNEGETEVYHAVRERVDNRYNPVENRRKEQRKVQLQEPRKYHFQEYVDPRSNGGNQTGNNRETTPAKNRKVNDRMNIDKGKQVRGKNRFERETGRYSITEDLENSKANISHAQLLAMNTALQAEL